jgi:putative membrane protein
MMYYGGTGGWAMAFMVVGNLLIWALLIGGIVLLVRYFGRGGQASAPVGGSPLPQQLLAERFARGEIDEDEYKRRLTVLGNAPQARKQSSKR